MRSPWQFEGGLRSLLVFSSLGFCLLGLEIPAFLNILDYQTIVGPYRRWAAKDEIRDPELLHIRKPHARDRGSAWGGDIVSRLQVPRGDLSFYRWDLRYDWHGFRNERDLERAGIVVIGDSFVESMTTPSESLVTSVLANLRGETVANLGQYQYGPQQELVVLRRYGLPLRPHTVVWMFSEASDLADTIRYPREVGVRRHFWLDFYDRSFTRNAFALLKYYWQPPARIPGVRNSAILHLPDGRTMTQYFGYQSITGDLTPPDLQALDQAAGIIAEANRLLAARGARLIVAFVPTAFHVLHTRCEFPPESLVRTWSVNDMSDRLAKALQPADPPIGFLDLTPALVQAFAKGSVPYYRDDEHWSEAGHRVAAEAIDAYLRSPEARSDEQR
jgi:hypothetical protein